MQRLEVSCAERRFFKSLGFKELNSDNIGHFTIVPRHAGGIVKQNHQSGSKFFGTFAHVSS